MSELGRVVVVGGGVGGLTVALALRRAGVEVEVHEKYDHLARRASAFTLWSHAIKHLMELGVNDLERLGAELEHTEIRTGEGKLIEEMPVGEVSRALGAPSCEVDRRELRALCMELLGEGIVRLGSECVGIEQDGAGATALLKGGGRASGDLVIGADGAHSVTRGELAANPKLRYSGYGAWAGVLVGFEHELCAPNRHIEIWAGGSIGGVADLGRGRTRWYVGRRTPAGIGWGTVDKQELLDHTASWYAPVREAVAAADPDSITTMESWELAPLARWVDRRLVLLGDSAHLTTPSVSGGACTAIVDAVSLARHLTSGAPVDDALASFQAERKKRDEAMVKRSRWIGKLQHMHTPIGVWLRDHAMEHVPASTARRLGEEMASGT